MRVLDVGSGMGDVALLVAELVGPTGTVVGVDKNPDVLAAARQRVPANVTFVTGDIREVELDGEFDAVVGRLVLMYLQDPTAAVASAARFLHPGGVVAFLEAEIARPGFSVPQVPLQQQLLALVDETFRRGGVERHMGSKLRRTLLNAGLSVLQLHTYSITGGGPGWAGYRFVEETMRSILPFTESLGVATAAEVDVDTIAARLEAEAVRLDSTMFLSTWIGAWARKE
ncbi:MAG: methyltransferase domain-containing protein [Caldilineaceae bacterium]|nr:methyltransferase domain-containing protein [Caldilineaceae bacterium]